MIPLITGLDLGGAHLKAAQVTTDGSVAEALQLPCTLWRGLDHLETALVEAKEKLRPLGRIAVTMTGELVDFFPDRRTGVARLLGTLTAAWPEAACVVWAGYRGFVPLADAAAHAGEIASANWLATAKLVARRVGDGLLVDLGSTTTDVIVCAGSEVRAAGMTDRERLATGELVYAGLTRTPVMALAAEAPFAGRRVALMNELFATSADLYRLLGLLSEDADQHGTADGGPKTPVASARRLARMIGADLVDGQPEDWRRFAGVLARCLARRVEDAVALQLSRGLIPDQSPLIGAGCGRFLVGRLADGMDRPWRDFVELIRVEGHARDWAATCAPAVAVALLLAADCGD